MFKRIKILLYISIITIINSCNQNPNYVSLKCNTNFTILDSIGYTVFPNDNFYPSGNSIFKKIKNTGNRIKPCLIELIKDTTETNFRIADSYNYKKSDLAILLIPYISNKPIKLRELLFDEFKNELKGKNKEVDFYSSLHYSIFFSNSNLINYKNRLRFYKKIKMDN